MLLVKFNKGRQIQFAIVLDRALRERRVGNVRGDGRVGEGCPRCRLAHPLTLPDKLSCRGR